MFKSYRWYRIKKFIIIMKWYLWYRFICKKDLLPQYKTFKYKIEHFMIWFRIAIDKENSSRCYWENN